MSITRSGKMAGFLCVVGLSVAALGGSAMALEPPPDEQPNGKREVPVIDRKSEPNSADFRLAALDSIPKSVFDECRSDFRKSEPPYRTLDVKKLTLLDKLQYDEKKKLYYIYFYHSKYRGAVATNGGVAYVYDPDKKALTGKFWLPPEGDE